MGGNAVHKNKVDHRFIGHLIGLEDTGRFFNWSPLKVHDPMQTSQEFFKVSAVIKIFCTKKI